MFVQFPLWLTARSLSVSDGHRTLGAASYLLYGRLSQQRGKCLLLSLLLPSALCHLLGSCWKSLVQGSGMGSLEMPSHGCVTEGDSIFCILQAFLGHSKYLPLDVLLAHLSSKQRDSLGHLQQSLRQCPLPTSPVATNVQTPSRVVRWCEPPPVLSCVPRPVAFMGTLHSTGEFPTHPGLAQLPLQDQCQLLVALKPLWGHNTRHWVWEGWGCPALGTEGWWHEGADLELEAAGSPSCPCCSVVPQCPCGAGTSASCRGG